MSRVFKLERKRSLPNDGCRTLSFSVQLGSRSRGYVHFKPSEVPEFDGDVGWFEVERKNGRWHIIRQVEMPALPDDLAEAVRRKRLLEYGS